MKVNWIEIDNIKSFRNNTKVVLNNDHNFIVGTNGSGKTTLLQVLGTCILVLVPPSRTESSNQGNIKKLQFNAFSQNINLPRNYDRQGDTQKVTIELSLESSKDGLIKELEAYHKIFQENEEYINQNYWSQEGLVGNAKSSLDAFKTYSGYVFKIEFEVLEANGGHILSPTGASRQENLGLFNVLENIEVQRVIYDQLFRVGKTSEIVDKGFHIVYLGADRQTGFPNELSLNKGSIDEFLNNTAYSRKADLINNLYANNSFDYISQTLTRISEKFVYKRWQLLEKDPLKSIDEYEELKKHIKKLLDFDFEIIAPGSPYENMQFVFTSGNHRVYFDQLSSGEKSLVYFLFTLANPDIKNSFILIDEAEIHLHGNMQDTLLEIIFSKEELTNQHFISTHSPKLINKLTISSVIRFFKNNNVTEHLNFRTETDLGSDYDVVRLINSQNNEKVFFADKVVLVEGIKDRILIETIIKHLNDTKDIIEVIDVGGKLNLLFYKKYLDEIKVRSFILADFDFLYNVRKKEIESLLETKTKKIDEIIKDKKSDDSKSLIEAIEEYVDNNDKSALEGVLTYLKSRGIKLKATLTATDTTLLRKTVGNLQEEGIYVISEGVIRDREKYSGEIEDYLLHISINQKGGEAVNTLVENIAKSDFLKDLGNKNEKVVILELLTFVSSVILDDKTKGQALLAKLRA